MPSSTVHLLSTYNIYSLSLSLLLTICKAQTGYVNGVCDGGPAPHWCHSASTQLPITRVFKRHIEITFYHPAKSFSSSRIASMSMLDTNEWVVCRTHSITMSNVIGSHSPAAARTNKIEWVKGFGQEHFNERVWVVASSSQQPLVSPPSWILNTRWCCIVLSDKRDFDERLSEMHLPRQKGWDNNFLFPLSRRHLALSRCSSWNSPSSG